MTYLSIIEKLQILFNILLDFKIILIFTILLLLFTFLYIIRKVSDKKYILCIFLSFIILFSMSIFSNYKILSNTFDNFTTILFRNIYFPSIYVYIGVLVISFISFITSMLNVMLKKIYKVINTIMLILNNILLVIVLNIIAKHKIDIFSVNSLYTDTTLVVVLELSMGLFILWILSLIAVYTTNCLCERLSRKKVHNIVAKENVVFNPTLEINYDIVNDSNHNDENLTTLVETIDNNSEDNINIITSLIEESTQEVIDDNIIISNIDEVNYDIESDTTNNDENLTTLVETIDNNSEDNMNIITSVIEELTQEVIDDNKIISNSDEVNNNILNEEIHVTQNEINNYHVETTTTFNDILNGNIPITYYDNNLTEEEYKLIDPQEIYENKYNNIKKENIVFNDINILLDNNIDEKVEISVEEKTSKEIEKLKEERLITNTISLNDLIKEEENNSISKLENEEHENKINQLKINEEKQKNTVYTIDDYKKISKMLNEIKMHSNCANINIDDAVALSLISNYSIDDCMKFKNILESNLN